MAFIISKKPSLLKDGFSYPMSWTAPPIERVQNRWLGSN